MLRIKTRFQNISLINVHAPTEEKELEKDAFYQKVEEIYDSCPSNHIKIVLGDWNAKAGREEIYQGVIGRHSMHLNSNTNGQRLADFAAAKNMVVSSTCSPHKEIHKQTWRSPDGKTNNQMDHILIDTSNRTTRRLHVDALREANTVRRFQQQLEEEFGNLETEWVTEEESHIEEDWKQLKEVIMEAAEQTIRYQPKPERRGWFDDECHKALEEKNAAYKKWIDRPTRAKRMEYERLREKPIKYVKTGKECILIFV